MTSTAVPLQSCRGCGRAWHTVLPSCPYCAGIDLERGDASGLGRVYSWVTVARSLEDPPRPVPYTIIAVDLDVGARVFGRYDATEEPVAGERVACCRVEAERNGALTFRSVKET